ncbi:MAG: glutamate--tRNA ligase [Rhodospirillales bacterium]|nr:glutamate--tRNA ligase [Alphaproteobacteria bacterium]USO03310.1 MAG: glutamate--tRNA ligase [Rhodospirillales bacterium]
MSVVTRFPPSPTGFMHIGNARTALFNYLYAKAKGGKFLLRIEDTDRKRHSEEAVQVIYDALEWMGLKQDNIAESQYENRHRHAEIARELLAAGKAYKCYCSPEELEEMREKARAEGKPSWYDRRWREEAGATNAAPPEGVEPVIRIKAPLEGESTIEDKVQGKVTVKNDQLDDFIILRSDGTPTYMLAVVVDDHDMGVTHVMRGDDHLNNTFRQNVIYEAMGWDIPTYAHLPLIHGPDGAKFSKRHGAQSIEEYRLMGYLPEALCNYLLRLGWGHGDDEIISMAQAIEWFDFDGIGKAAARFDFAKLESLNAHYIHQASDERLVELTLPFMQEHQRVFPDTEGLERLKKGMPALKERAKTLLQIAEDGAFYCRSLPFEYDEAARKLLDEEAKSMLPRLLERFQDMEAFDHESIESACRALAEEGGGGKLGKIMMPLRAALTGTNKSPPLFEAAEILGKAETCKRIQAVLDH